MDGTLHRVWRGKHDMSPLKSAVNSVHEKFTQEKPKALHFGITQGITTEWMWLAWTVSCRRCPEQLMVDVWQGTSQHFTLNMNKASCMLGFVTRSTSLAMGGIATFPGMCMRVSEFPLKHCQACMFSKHKWNLTKKRQSGTVLIIHCTLSNTRT